MTPLVSWVRSIRDRVWTECDPAAILASGADDAPRIIAALARGFLDEEMHGLSAHEIASVEAGVVAATLGLGPLQPLLADDSISEIMVNGPHRVFIERHGRLEQTDAMFDNDEHVLHVIDRILAPIGRRIDALSPTVDARLPDGSRVHAIIPPLAVDGPVLTIRRFVRVVTDLDDLVRVGSVSSIGAMELERLVRARSTVLVSGGTSSGKTTLLAAALGAADVQDRIVVIEDAAELPLEHPHRVRLECRVSSHEGAQEVTMRTLVRNALRMRPDRLILGEVRGAEAYDLLQALNTGHRGSWSTIHANGPEESLLRLESMVLCAGTGMPHEVVREQVARAIDAVVHLERDSEGQRRIVDICDVRVVNGAHASWSLQSRLAPVPGGA